MNIHVPSTAIQLENISLSSFINILGTPIMICNKTSTKYESEIAFLLARRNLYFFFSLIDYPFITMYFLKCFAPFSLKMDMQIVNRVNKSELKNKRVIGG